MVLKPESADTYKDCSWRLGEKAAVIEYPIGHFDIYHGEHFEKQQQPN